MLMKGALKMSQAQTSKDTPNVISSPESAVGPKLSALPGGQQIVLFGQDHVPASHFPAPANGKGKKISGTCGLNSIGLLESANLQSSLENRLQARLDVNGSPEYALTWKRWDMPSGPPICALRASTRRISGKDCTGWPTPRTSDMNGAGEHGQGGKDLRTTVQLAGWGTPNCMDHLPSSNLEARKKKGGCSNLKDQVTIISGQTPSGFLVKTEKPAGLVLNPHFSRWLMGYRAEWLCSEVLETLSSRK
jgi:hypothetical protein